MKIEITLPDGWELKPEELITDSKVAFQNLVIQEEVIRALESRISQERRQLSYRRSFLARVVRREEEVADAIRAEVKKYNEERCVDALQSCK